MATANTYRVEEASATAAAATNKNNQSCAIH